MRTVTHDDVLGLRSAGDARISPDGSSVAFVVADGWTGGMKNPRSNLWLVPAAGGTPVPLTGGPQSDLAPQWAPDGRRLAFLSDRAEAKGGPHRLYLVNPATGRIQPVDCPPGDVQAFRWSGDGGALAALIKPKASPETGDPICFEATTAHWRLWVLPLDGAPARAVTPENLHVWEFDWSPDGRQFALLAADTPYEWSWYQARLVLVDAAGGPVATLHDPGHRQVARPLFAPDGRQVAFLSAAWSDRGSVAGDLWLVPAGGDDARNVTAGYGGSVTWMEWETDRSLLLMAYEGYETVVAELAPGQPLRYRARGLFSGWPRAWPRFSRSGPVLALGREDANRPPDIWTVTLGAGEPAWRQLTGLNPQVAGLRLGQTEVFRWHSPDGQEIDGLLTLPVGYRPGERCPLVVNPHGGPTSRSALRFTPLWAQFLAARGCAVLQPNYRGSTGRGLAFAEANLGDMGGGDFRDIMAGVDACVAAGIAHPDRLGFGGWSYGGFLTAWAVTQTDRFKAAVMGAGIANWLSFHGRSYLQTWDQIYLQASPYRGDTYARWSPIYYVDRVRTPTLIVHGEEDGDVPVGQSYEFHRALVEHGVETQLVVYPREAHGLREPAHLRDLWGRTVDWFARHLGLPE